MGFSGLSHTIKNALHYLSCFSSRSKDAQLAPVLEAQTVSPPWPPQSIIDNRITYMAQVRARSPRAIKGTDRDTPLDCLYRLYELLVLDDTIGYRNEIEYFWHHAGWAVAGIPDPRDPEPTRYAFMAAIPEILVRAFNRNIGMGLARYTPAIISPEEAEALRNTPENAKLYESSPDWTSQVRPTTKTLTVPMVEGPELVDPTEKELDAAFLKLNIRLGVPHIHFT